MDLDNLDENGLVPLGDDSEEQTSQTASVKRRKRQKKIDFKGKSVSEVLGIASNITESDKSDFTIYALDIDRELFNNIKDVSPIVKNLVESGDNILKTYNEFSNDLFQSLYQSYPELYDPENVKGPYQFNYSMVDALANNPDHAVLRDYCQLDEFGSALASLNLHENTIDNLTDLYNEIKEDPNNIIDKINEAKENKDNIDQLISEIQEIQEIQDNHGTSQQIDDLKDANLLSLQQALALAQKQGDIMTKANATQQDQLRKVQEVITESLRQSVVQVAKDCEMVEAWGFNRGGDVRVSIDSKLRAIKALRNSKKLKQFSDIIGKLRECAIKQQMSKNKDGISAIKSISSGSKIERVLPSELMLICNPITKADFYKRYLEGSLFQYEMDQFEKKGKGPLIVCIDVSGSMDGDREIYSKAFAVALLDIAQIQRRNFGYISFESCIVTVFVQEKGYLDPARVVEICEEGTRGGTNYQPPLEKALELIKDSRFKGADIVFITDGECSLNESFIRKFKQVKEEKEFCCRGIVVDIGSRVSTKALESFCDKIEKVSKIADLSAEGAVAQEIFRDL